VNGAGPVGFGVIGARSMVATNAVMPAIDASRHARLTAVAALGGPVPERWSDLTVGGYDDVLTHPDVDAVYIPLPNGLHRAWAERAAAAGKHVLCEKPIAPSAADASAMAAACDAAGVVLAEAWMTPFDARWRHVVDTARDGGLGEIVDIDTSFAFTMAASDNYRWSPEQGGGALLDVGIYCLGPIVALWGSEPDVVDATARWDRRGVDARTEATLEWADGRRARVRCSFVDDEEQRIEFVGTSASLVVDGHAHTGGSDATAFVVASADETVRREAVVPSDPYLGMVDAFARTVRGETAWLRPMHESIELLQLLERIAEACR